MDGRDQDDGEPAAEEELLGLRLRVEGLERELEATAAALGVRAAQLDAQRRSRLTRGLERLGTLRRTLDPAAVVANGFDGSGKDGVRVPLAGLDAEVHGTTCLRWTDAIEVAGVTLGGVAVDPPTTMTFRITGADAVHVRAFAALRPAAWAHNRGGVRFRITVADADGRTVATIERDVHPGLRSEDRRWVPVVLEAAVTGPGPHAVTLSTELPPDAPADFAWAVWGDPVLLVPAPGGRAVTLPSTVTALRATAARARRSRRTTAHGAAPESAPTISLLLPVHDPAPELLRATLASVLEQTDAHWQLCVADDGSADPQVREILRDAARDPRVDVQRQDTAGGISAATNLALTRARGEFVATLDHDDLLAPDAIAQVRAALARDPAIDVLYSDNDKVGPGGVRFAPSLKPGWSPDLLRACMYTLHLGVYRRSLVEAVGGWRPAFDGAQDHDLLLRLSERTDRIDHLPATLYGWRAHAGSAALEDRAKPQAYARAVAAIDEHLERLGVPAHAEALPIAGRYRVVREPGDTAQAVVVPLTADRAQDPATRAEVDRMAEALPDSELVVVVAIGLGDAARASRHGLRVVEHDGATWGALAAAGIAVAGAAVVVLAEELAVPLAPDWPAEVLGALSEPGIVASAPLVLDEEDRVVHAGVALLGGLPLPVHPGASTTADDLPPELTMVTNRSGASGIAALRRETLLTAGAPDPTLDHLCLAELTARLTRSGGRVLCTPHAPWRVLGRPRARTTALEELRRVAAGARGRRDPFYNPRLWPDRAAHLVPRALQHTGLLADEDGT